MRRLLLGAMVATLASPLPWTLLVNRYPEAFGMRLRAAPLIDHAKPPAAPQWSPAQWWSGDLQKTFEPWFAAALEPRGWIIRRVNQIYYSLFRKSYMYEGQIIVGRDETLYGLEYLEAHCKAASLGAALPPPSLMERLDRLSRAHAARGGTVVFVVSPSKVEALPEKLPDGLCRRRSAERPAARWVAELRRRGIAVVDGPALLEEMASADPVPPFPRGGVHWSRLAATRVAAVVVDEARRRVAGGVGTMELEGTRWDAHPVDTDADFASLLNLRHPPLDYPVGKAEVRCRPEPGAPGLIGIGGSFLIGVIEPMVACGLFREVEYYNYYDVAYRRYPEPYSPVDRKRVDWAKILAARPVLVLEVNESIVYVPVIHLEKLLEDVERASPATTGRDDSRS